MTNFARITNDIAIDVSTDPYNSFHPTLASAFVPVPDEVQHGWIHDVGNDTWAAPLEPPPVQIDIIVTKYQGDTQLEDMGLYTTVVSFPVTSVKFDLGYNAPTWNINADWVQEMKMKLSWTDQDLQDFFNAAALVK